MRLTDIQPKTSRASGGVIFDLYGKQLSQNDDIQTINFTNFANISAGAIAEEVRDGVVFELKDAINQLAAVEVNKVFGRAYSYKVSIEKMDKSYPLIDKARALAITAMDQLDITRSVTVGIEYYDQTGYQIFIESNVGNGKIDKVTKSIDPSRIKALRIVNTDRYFHGYAELDNGTVYIGKTKELRFPSSLIKIYSSTPQNGCARCSNIKIKTATSETLVTLAGYPATIISKKDDSIRGKTSVAEITIGSVIVALPSGEISELSGNFRYVRGNGVAQIRKQFDTIVAVYSEVTNPSREKLFTSNSGFKWDEGYFFSKRDLNNDLYVPSLWDPTTGNVPKTFWVSGIGSNDALKYNKIKKHAADDVVKWHAHLNHGTYFIGNLPYYLFSDESVVEYLKEEVTEDQRSILKLKLPPKQGIPLSVSTLTEEKETKRIIDKVRFQKKGRFTGKVINGVELDTTSSNEAIDQTRKEFIVKYNKNNTITNYKIPYDSTFFKVEGNYFLYSFALPKAPIKDFKLRFSRKDIFYTEKIRARKYDEGKYDEFRYGEGVVDPGDYCIDYENNKVEVLVDIQFKDFGVVSYEYDYPAIIEFNNNYTQNRGIGIEIPTYKDLSKFDDRGYSDGTSRQTFRIKDFPIIDNSTYSSLDRDNFKLYIYDESDNFFDGDWVRVKSLKEYGPNDKVYLLDPDIGLISFGDGVNGAIPTKYKRVLAAYKPTVKVQYEPESSSDEWVGTTLDLNLGKSSLNSGFLYLSRKKLIPSKVKVEFATNDISSFDTTEVKATVWTNDRDLITGIPVHFEIVAGGGRILDPILVTDASGIAQTIFTPSTKLEDMGIRVDIFSPSESIKTPGTLIPNVYQSELGVDYRILKANEIIAGDLNDIYLFKILDDNDPFLPYDNRTRKGGRFVVLFGEGINGREVIKPKYIAGSTIGFDIQLPQPYNKFDANYDPSLRGFYIVAKKTIQLRAYVQVDDVKIYSDIISLRVKYSDIQKGQWKLPIPPIEFKSSQIDTATYLDMRS